jgi:hypothetical protein
MYGAINIFERRFGFKAFQPTAIVGIFRAQYGNTGYKLNTVYKHAGPLRVSRAGFHFCDHRRDVFHYYPRTSVLTCIEVLGTVVRNGDLCCTDEFKISSLVTAVLHHENSIDYYQDGVLHRDRDLPAVIWKGGTKEWYWHGKRHRDGDLPAIERANGTKEWFKNGQRHRDNGLPAIEWANGDKEWYRGDWWARSQRN